MDQNVQNAIARIEVVDDRGVVSWGTASLVGDNLVLTALHVVADREANPVQFRRGEILLTFPNHQPVKATVLDGKWNGREDWVLLTCTDDPPNVRPLRLATLERDDDRWETYGYPEAQPLDGMVCTGTVENHNGILDGAPVHQLFCRQAAAGDGMPVKGLSGAPVVIAGAVTGVLRFALSTKQVEVDGRTTTASRAGTIYACPATRVAAGCLEYFPERLPFSPTPSRKWRLAAAASLGVLLVAGYPIWRLLTTPPPLESTEIVIDTSDGMNAPFDGLTKIKAAAAALQKEPLLHPTVNLALRGFGGKCFTDEDSQLLVRFGKQRRDPIVKASAQVQPGGDSTLVDGVVWAINDIKALPNQRRVVVLTGNVDACSRDPEKMFQAIAAKVKEDKEHKVDLDIRFIGLAVPPEDEALLQKLSDHLGGGQVQFTRTVAQLNAALDYVLVVEPAVGQVKSVLDIVHRVDKSVNGFIGNINQRKYDEAQGNLHDFQELYDSNRLMFDRAAGDRLSLTFQVFYKLAVDDYALQEQLLKLGTDLIREGRALGQTQSPAYVAALDRWNATMDKGNANIHEMNAKANEIVNENMKRR